jgi:hypothetical protein
MQTLKNGLKLVINPIRRHGMVRLYGVGAAKTGTHSLAEMFGDRVPSGHEADGQAIIVHYLDALESGDHRKLRRYLRRRDARRNLKFDVSLLNVYLLDHLMELYPDSRYVMTIRPPMSWLRSVVDDNLRREVDPAWDRFRHFRYDFPDPYPVEEAALKEAGAFQIAGYLRYWRDSITQVTDKVPAGSLFIVKTDELAARAEEIAQFCGIPGGAVPQEKSHAFANPTRFGLLSQVPEEHLLKLAREYCGALMERQFPERDLVQDVREIRGKA